MLPQRYQGIFYLHVWKDYFGAEQKINFVHYGDCAICAVGWEVANRWGLTNFFGLQKAVDKEELIFGLCGLGSVCSDLGIV